jgi:hypothetical protein
MEGVEGREGLLFSMRGREEVKPVIFLPFPLGFFPSSLLFADIHWIE